MTLVSSLNIARSALSASQAAITVVSNNISNVDTDGYSKLSAQLATVVSTDSSTTAIDEANSLSGVTVSSIKRYSDTYLENTYRTANSAYSYASKADSIATDVESTMNDLKSTGLTTALSTFYSAVSSLSSNPTDASARESYVSAAQNLCSVFNDAASSLSTSIVSLVGDYKDTTSIGSSEISSDVTSVNNLLDQIADVNDSIIKSNSADISSASLLDERDSLLTKLSALIPTNVTENDNGTVKVSLGNNTLVSGNTVKGYLQATSGTEDEPAVINIVDKDGNTVASNVNSDINSGTIGAILDTCGTDSSKFTISGVLSSLNTLASSFASVMNEIQTGDPNKDGTTAFCLGTDSSGKTILTQSVTSMFVNSDSTTSSTTGITAANISVNSAIIADKNLVAAARTTGTTDATTGVVTPTDTSATGNNSNVTLLTNSETKTSTTLENQTFSGYLSSTVSDVGTSVSSLDNTLTTKTSVLSSVKSKLTSETGVDLDEELTDMIKYQRSYQAAARIFSTCNSLMDTLVQLGQ